MRMPHRSLAAAASLLACFGLGSACASAHDIAWYDGSLGSLPTDQCWSFVQEDSAVVPTMEGNAAHLGPTILSGRSYWRRDLTPFIASDGAAATVVSSIISSSYIQTGQLRRCGFSITMTDALGRWARLGVSSNRVLLQTSTNGVFDQVKTYQQTPGDHSFRLEFVGTEVRVLVDGTVMLTGFAGVNGEHPNTVLVGDTTIWGHSNTETSLVMIESVALCGGADLNCDQVVNAIDMGILLANWGDPACSSDLDGDGLTGSGDLAILLSQWSQ